MPFYQTNHPYPEPNKAKARARNVVSVVRRCTVTRESTDLSWDVFTDKQRNMYEAIELPLRLRHGVTLGTWQELDDHKIFRDMFYPSEESLVKFDREYRRYFEDKHKDQRLQTTRNNFYEILFTDDSGYKIDLQEYYV